LNQNALGDLSPSTAQQKLVEAQRQYNEQLALANAGNNEALSNITNYADALLQAAKDVNGFGGSYSAIYAAVRADLAALLPADTLSAGDNAIVSNIVQLRTDVVDMKEVLARLMERQLEATLDQTDTVEGAVVASGDAVSSTVTTAAVVNERR
jgi:hypothetical protein